MAFHIYDMRWWPGYGSVQSDRHYANTTAAYSLVCASCRYITMDKP